VGGNWSKRGDFPSNANSDFEGVTFTPDSSRVVAVDFGSSTLQILDPVTLTTVGTPRTLPAKPDSLAVSPVAAGAALYAAVGMNDGRVAIVDLNAASTTAPQLVTGSSTPDDIPVVAFSPDGKVLAAGSSLELTSVTLWNVGPQVTAKTPAPNLGANVEGGIAGLAFSPDGTSLLVGYGYFSPAVGIWDVATAQNHGTKVPREPPLGVSFSPSGAVAVAGEAFYGWILVCAD
jgi:WD40 repeat protein